MKTIIVIGLCVCCAIFAVYEIYSLVRDIRKRVKNKSAVDNGLKGDLDK